MNDPKIMGILNVTPDSFSDGGLYLDPDAAIARGVEMFTQGADIVDVGGESTRPGSLGVDVETELQRVLPVVERLASEGVVSIDTTKPEVAAAACTAGATIVNDVSASLAEVAAYYGAGWIAMHVQGSPQSMQDNPEYRDVVTEVAEYLSDKATQASSLGIETVWVDPGFGFGKTLEHNIELLANIDRLTATGWPVAVGMSRKSMLGTLLAVSDGAPQAIGEDDRLDGSLISSSYAMMMGVNLVRVHDVEETVQVRSVIAGSEAHAKRKMGSRN